MGMRILSYTTTQKIEGLLDGLVAEMPEELWAIPGNFILNRTVKAGKQFIHLFLQTWFFQLHGLLHLLFMLRSAKKWKFEYSRFMSTIISSTNL
ncbi:hypothetical protein BJ878DRAFT_544045 [Calycina marina]|uniref:Uncharacterized protein n=1 Tax=Calycina marina TaxID=1763456 RepID=A0A9P8CD51_9HELO|nr:hypothetical protein BJ878DRAFT_544045 [Calycina marina]